MQVAELAESLAKRQEARFIAKLGDFRIADDASSVEFGAQNRDGSTMQGTLRFLLDEQALSVLSHYLKIPVKYLNDCPPDFRATTLKFWCDRKSRAEVVVESVEGEMVGLYSPGLIMLPVRGIGEMVERVFAPTDEIHQLIRDTSRFHLDVTSNRFQVDVPNPNRVPGRPEVGDITCGGVRFLAVPNKVAAPSVARFFRRVFCSNGMTVPETQGRISIAGLTVGEVIASMEEAAQRLLSTMDESLDRYKETANMPVPGHPVSFAEQLGTEMSIPARVLHNVLDNVRQLPETGTTVYDINQSFTVVANDVRNYDTRVRLQALGGSLALDAARMIERCGTCERLL
jgi:hypothetical protein